MFSHFISSLSVIFVEVFNGLNGSERTLDSKNIFIYFYIGSRNSFQYFWRVKGWIVGPLSENKISGSGLFFGAY